MNPIKVTIRIPGLKIGQKVWSVEEKYINMQPCSVCNATQRNYKWEVVEFTIHKLEFVLNVDGAALTNIWLEQKGVANHRRIWALDFMLEYFLDKREAQKELKRTVKESKGEIDNGKLETE